MFVANIVHLARAPGQCFVIVGQLSQHLQRGDAFDIEFENGAESGKCDRSISM